MSETERLHMISDLEEKYTIELDREYIDMGTRASETYPPLVTSPVPTSARATVLNFFWV